MKRSWRERLAIHRPHAWRYWFATALVFTAIRVVEAGYHVSGLLVLLLALDLARGCGRLDERLIAYYAKSGPHCWCVWRRHRWSIDKNLGGDFYKQRCRRCERTRYRVDHRKDAEAYRRRFA